MVDPCHETLSITAQCHLLSISRSGWYYDPKGEPLLNLKLMRLIDEQFLLTPYYGSRQMARWLRRQGYGVGVTPSPAIDDVDGFARDLSGPVHELASPTPSDLSVSSAECGYSEGQSGVVYRHHLYPDQTGGRYLGAIMMDWQSQKVLSWRLSNTMEAPFCIEALEEALTRYGVPEIFNTDQGSQFTSGEFTAVLKDHGINISMDGKGRWRDNVFIERLWRSLKYECVYLHAFENGVQARTSIGAWLSHDNQTRPHSTFDGHTPDEVYNLSHFQRPEPDDVKHAA